MIGFLMIVLGRLGFLLLFGILFGLGGWTLKLSTQNESTIVLRVMLFAFAVQALMGAFVGLHAFGLTGIFAIVMQIIYVACGVAASNFLMKNVKPYMDP